MVITVLQQGHFALQTRDRSESLSNLVAKSKNVLLIVSSIFPLDLFPDILTIDKNKVNIIHNTFFGELHAHSILIEDIIKVTVNTNPFFATLHITDSSNLTFPQFTIHKLKIRDALFAHNLIQGLIKTSRRNVAKKTCALDSVEGVDNK